MAVLSGLGAGILGATNLLGSQASEGYGFSDSVSDSSNGYSGQSSGFSNSSWGGESSSESNAYSNYDAENWSQIYGSEASAKDIERAKEANQLQDAYLLAQMEYNSKEAQIARDWEEYMSNTAYQRAIADLEKAGLNPILAVQNMGASTPMGVFASSGLQTAYKANTYADSRSQGYATGRAKSHSESSSSSWGSSHSENQSSESGGGSSHSESHSEQSSRADSVASRVGKTIGEAVSQLWNSTSGKQVFEKGMINP